MTESNRDGRRVLPVVLLTLFLDLIAFSIIFPLYPEMMDFYGTQEGGLLPSLLAWFNELVPNADDGQKQAFVGGILMAAFALLQFIASPLWGALSDRIGRRPVVLVTIAGNVLAHLLWIVADSFLILLLSRALGGIMTGNLSVLTAAAADTSTPDKRTRVMGAVGAAFGLGFLLGPALGALSFHLLPQMTGGPLNPFSGPAIVACALAVLNFVWAYRAFAETLPQDLRGQGGTSRGLNPITMLLRPAHGRPLLNAAYFFFIGVFSAVEFALVFLVTRVLAYDPKHIGWLFVWLGIISILVQGGLVRRLDKKLPPKGFVLLGACCLGPGMLALSALPAQPQLWLLLVSTGLIAFGVALASPGYSSWISLVSAREVQGLSLGQMRSLGALARVIGPTVAAILYFVVSPSAPFYIGACLLVIPLAHVIFASRSPSVPVPVSGESRA